MKKAFYILSLITLFGCSNEKKSTQSAKVDTVQTNVATSPSQTAKAISEKPAAKRTAFPLATTWVYENKSDKIGGTVAKASITSPDSLKFGFPYADGSTATLSIRKRDGSTTLYLRVSNGQFNRSFQGGNARIRFDSEPAATYTFSAAANGSANVIFFDEVKKLIKKIKASRKMIIDVDFYAQGTRQIEFRTAGLTWK
jgi:outer membrane murein-binding lipoprotein Lpp